MWTGPQKCWTVGMRTSTHVSYKLTAARVNAGRVKNAPGACPCEDELGIVPLIKGLLGSTGKWAERGKSVNCCCNDPDRRWIGRLRNHTGLHQRSCPVTRLRCSQPPHRADACT